MVAPPIIDGGIYALMYIAYPYAFKETGIFNSSSGPSDPRFNVRVYPYNKFGPVPDFWRVNILDGKGSDASQTVSIVHNGTGHALTAHHLTVSADANFRNGGDYEWKLELVNQNSSSGLRRMIEPNALGYCITAQIQDTGRLPESEPEDGYLLFSAPQNDTDIYQQVYFSPAEYWL